MKAFSAVARHLSFTAGANELGLSTKVISNQVRHLEDRLGVQLLHRTTRRVTLTDTGKAYLERCVTLLQDFEDTESLVQEWQSELAGPIRISAPTAFGSAELIQAIGPFQAAHPKVQVDLRLSDHHVNIVDEGFDLAVRFGQLQDSTLLARKLLTMRVVVFAAPKYLEQHGEPQHPSALSTHNCLLQQSSAEPAIWRFQEDDKPMSVRVQGSFKANSPRAVAHAAVGGVGIGMAPLYVVQPFIQTGELKLLFESFEATAFPLQAVYPPTKHLVLRVRALIDHLVEHFAE